jgi:hypothetical protein
MLWLSLLNEWTDGLMSDWNGVAGEWCLGLWFHGWGLVNASPRRIQYEAFSGMLATGQTSLPLWLIPFYIGPKDPHGFPLLTGAPECLHACFSGRSWCPYQRVRDSWQWGGKIQAPGPAPCLWCYGSSISGCVLGLLRTPRRGESPLWEWK